MKTVLNLNDENFKKALKVTDEEKEDKKYNELKLKYETEKIIENFKNVMKKKVKFMEI